MFRRKLISLIKKVNPRLGLKDDDIILASFPRSGNTWFRFIWLNIVSIIELNSREIDFHYINGPLVAEYDSNSYGEINYECLPRLVKTHKPFDQCFAKNPTIYLVRNPGDVMISYYEYLKGEKKGYSGFQDISGFIRSSEYGIRKWCNHVKNWSKRADIIVSYESLKKDAFLEIKRVLDYFNLSSEIEDDILDEAVRKSSFKNMRKTEREKGRPNKTTSDFNFTRKGKTGEWKERLSTSDKKYIKLELDKFCLDDKFTI